MALFLLEHNTEINIEFLLPIAVHRKNIPIVEALLAHDHLSFTAIISGIRWVMLKNDPHEITSKIRKMLFDALAEQKIDIQTVLFWYFEYTGAKIIETIRYQPYVGYILNQFNIYTLIIWSVVFSIMFCLSIKILCVNNLIANCTFLNTIFTKIRRVLSI